MKDLKNYVNRSLPVLYSSFYGLRKDGIAFVNGSRERL